MKTKILLSMLTMLSLVATGSRSLAQTNPVFIQLGQAKGALYRPDSGPPPHVGIVVMHRESNYMNNIACREFSRRGFMVLCMNSRFENNEALVDWELIPLDVAQGVNHLRNIQQMSKVILYGNSGGGVTMSFYRPELKEANQTFSEGSREGLTVRSFLSSSAIRATNSMDELQIDLCSSNNSTPCMLQKVTVPLLAAANQASFQNLIQEVEINYLYAKSTDKDFIVVEGATTGVTPCTNCPLPASAYSNVTNNFFNYAAKWINDRFP